MSFIEIKNLTFEYRSGSEDKEAKKERAIDGVNLSIDKGEFVAVIGKNGSGKSTLAKMINGILLPKDGSVTVDGMLTEDQDKIYDIRSRVAMVFQNPDNQIVSSIVEDDVAFGPENLGIQPDEIRIRVDEALKSVDMYDYRHKAPHRLSGGQKQRIAIAGAIAMKPECIIFDEPTAMLDPDGKRKVMEIIKDLNAKGIGVILITHFMEEAIKAPRIIVMKKGRIIKDDTPAAFFSDIDAVKNAGMELPVVIDLRKRLNESGIKMNSDIITEEEFIDAFIKEASGRK